MEDAFKLVFPGDGIWPVVKTKKYDLEVPMLEAEHCWLLCRKSVKKKKRIPHKLKIIN